MDVSIELNLSTINYSTTSLGTPETNPSHPQISRIFADRPNAKGLKSASICFICGSTLELG
jgi:hypothetical protein